MKVKPGLVLIPEWGKAALLALALLLFVHGFVLRWVTVRNTSMYATLLPGDLVGVERWPIWTGLERGDIIVFRDPVQDDRPMGQRQLLVKRIAGMPGDDVELRDGKLFVNGLPVPASPGQTSSWTVRLKAEADVRDLLVHLGLPPDHVLPGQRMIHLPLNANLASALRERPEVVSVTPRGSSTATPDHLFPFGPNFRWNNDNYGPLQVPAARDTVGVTAYTLPIYDRIISRYEHNAMDVSGGELRINGKPADSYAFHQDYYFVLGDSRDDSSDSRYWGFVPADHIVGRAGFILLNARIWGKHPVQGRSLKDL